MSNDAYEKRMAEMDQEFEAWWREEDDTDEPFFYGVSREVAHEIWRVAYRAGGHRPWTQINPTQLAVLRKMLGATQREQLAAFIMAHGMATGHGETFEDLLAELSWQIKEIQEKANG